ncbi:bestrophin family ion channel [Caballeronia sp. dw_19]|uniref:bestrophin family protein n=1 Tax=Caballeronia sp. dw_19 TaxID=2719791 RepID=UPI001BD5465B|nr:bestrophin family ion channel [Caballeronia sp. dw_19]
MIVRPPLHWLRALTAWRGSVLPGLIPRLSLVFALSLVALWLHDHRNWLLSPEPFGLIGISLAVFLGFRNKAAYDRYWEGRKLWGQLLIASRSLMRQALTFPQPACASPDAQAFGALLVAFAHALRHQLRGTDSHDDLHRLLPTELAMRIEAAPQRPAVLLLELSGWVQARAREGAFDGYRMLAFDENFNRLSAALGGCERIDSTPMPFAYSVMIHRTVHFFCALLPFSLVGSLGSFTPLFSVFVAYTFTAIESLAAELEEPFGLDPNDLALGALCIGIENAVHALLGDGIEIALTRRRDFVVS